MYAIPIDNDLVDQAKAMSKRIPTVIDVTYQLLAPLESIILSENPLRMHLLSPLMNRISNLWSSEGKRFTKAVEREEIDDVDEKFIKKYLIKPKDYLSESDPLLVITYIIIISTPFIPCTIVHHHTYTYVYVV